MKNITKATLASMIADLGLKLPGNKEKKHDQAKIDAAKAKRERKAAAKLVQAEKSERGRS